MARLIERLRTWLIRKLGGFTEPSHHTIETNEVVKEVKVPDYRKAVVEIDPVGAAMETFVVRVSVPGETDNDNDPIAMCAIREQMGVSIGKYLKENGHLCIRKTTSYDYVHYKTEYEGRLRVAFFKTEVRNASDNHTDADVIEGRIKEWRT